MSSKLRYFSLFSGIGAAELAFTRVFPDSICVGHSEIDEQALRIYKSHFPNHKNFGDVSKIDTNSIPPFDVLIGGSPCTGFSSMNADKKEWDDHRSRLILHYFRILEECRPKFFILENVASMTNEVKNRISMTLGIQPVFINSAFFTAQNRRRFYWTNFTVPPVNNDVRKVLLKDILDVRDDYRESKITIHGTPMKDILPQTRVPYAMRHLQNHNYIARDDNKMGPVLTTYSTCSVVWDGKIFRQLSPIELERLQGFPDNWTAGVRIADRVKCVGNAFTVPVIEYILTNLKLFIDEKKAPFPYFVKVSIEEIHNNTVKRNNRTEKSIKKVVKKVVRKSKKIAKSLSKKKVNVKNV